METLKEALIQLLDEKFVNKQEYIKNKTDATTSKSKFTNKKSKSDIKSDEKELAKTFKSTFGSDNLRLKYKGKEWYVKFSIHAMSRYIERGGEMDKTWLDELLTKMIKVLQFKPKGQMYLVYSVSMKRAMVVNRSDDDSFTVVTVYPAGDQKASANTKKVLIEQLEGTIFEGLIDEYIEIE